MLSSIHFLNLKASSGPTNSGPNLSIKLWESHSPDLPLLAPFMCDWGRWGQASISVDGGRVHLWKWLDHRLVPSSSLILNASRPGPDSYPVLLKLLVLRVVQDTLNGVWQVSIRSPVQGLLWHHLFIPDACLLRRASLIRVNSSVALPADARAIRQGALLDLLIHTCAVAGSRSTTLHLHKVRVIGAQQFCSLVEPDSSWSLRRQNFLCLDLLRLLLRSLYYAFRSLSKDTVPAPVTGSE